MKLTPKEQLKRDRLKFRSQVSPKPKQPNFSHKLLVAEADRVFSLYIRFVRDKDKPCITCWNPDTVFNNWHFQVRTHFNTRWSELNCAKQCVYCNKNWWWEQVIFARRIDEIYGAWTAEALEIYARKVTEMKKSDILEIIRKYYKILEDNDIDYKPVKKYLV